MFRVVRVKIVDRLVVCLTQDVSVKTLELRLNLLRTFRLNSEARNIGRLYGCINQNITGRPTNISPPC